MAQVIDALFKLFAGDEPRQQQSAMGGQPFNPAGVRGAPGSPSGATPTPHDNALFGPDGNLQFGNTPAGRALGGIGDFLSDNAPSAAQVGAVARNLPGQMARALPGVGPAVSAGQLVGAGRTQLGGGAAGQEAATAAPLPAQAPLPQVPGVSVDANLQGPDPDMAQKIMGTLEAALQRAGQAPPLPMKKPGAATTQAGAPPLPQRKPAEAGQPAGTTTKDVQDFFADVAAAGSGNTNSKFGAFMTGADRAIQSGRARTKEEDAASVASEERAYKRSRDAAGDRRADAKERREARRDAAQIRKIEAEVNKLINPTLDIKDKIALENQVSYLANSLIKDGTLTYDEIMEKTRELLQEKQARVLSQTGVGGNTQGGADSSAAGSTAPAGGVQEGATATNPQTGERIIYQGGKWVPAPKQ